MPLALDSTPTLPDDAAIADAPSRVPSPEMLQFLDDTHPVYDANVDIWAQNERRMRGGEAIVDELVPFEYEVNADGTKSDHYVKRQRSATYINFPDMYATLTVGHILREAPNPGKNLNFGTLGSVVRENDAALPSFAELVWYNADGVGNDGSEWNTWWANAQRRSCATGLRWIMCESPADVPPNPTYEDVLRGARPYLVEYSPISVPNWHFNRGRLEWALIRTPSYDRVVNPSTGAFDASENASYYLLVRRGCKSLGAWAEPGGWFLFDGDKELVDSGTWDKTKGEIPMTPLFYERDTGLVGDDEDGTNAVPSLARGGVTELGNCAVSYMNLSSAADYDAWDAAASVVFMLGVDADGYDEAKSVADAGSRWVPVPTNQDTEVAPTIFDGSTGAVTSDVFEKRLDRKFKEAEQLAALEADAGPNASGVSRTVAWNTAKAPRLALMASELQITQNSIIRFLELRFGNATPSGSVRWPRKFSLLDVGAKMREFADNMKALGATSATLKQRAAMLIAEDSGLITDDEDTKKIEDEFKADIAAQADAAAQEAALTASVLGGA